MRKHKTKRWTVLVMSDANKRVFQLNIPKISVFFVSALFIGLSIALYYSQITVKEVKQQNNKLHAQLSDTKEKLVTSNSKIDTYKQEAEAISHKVAELSQLEEELEEMVASMNPARIDESSLAPTGGIEVSANDELEILQEIQKDNTPESEQESLTSTYNRLNTYIPTLIYDFEDTIQNFSNIKTELKTTPTLWPTDAQRITSQFGNRSDPFTSRSAIHTGIDIAGPWGTPVYATADGTVMLARRDGGYGKSIVIEHNSILSTRYGHLSGIEVEEGNQVKKGDLIGYMGTTGRSTGVHLHYEILKNGTPIDPYMYMTFMDKVLKERETTE